MSDKPKIKGLIERKLEDPEYKKRHDERYAAFKLEAQILTALEEKGWTYSDLAKATGTSKNNVTRDLKAGGIWAASFFRIHRIAAALGMKLVALLIPKERMKCSIAGILLPLASLILAFSACSPKPSRGPREGANAFYKVYLEVRLLGLPEKKQQELLRPWISRGLSQLISDAGAAADGETEEGPPIIQEDIFSSNFEGATDFEVGVCSKWGARRNCKVKLSYVDPYDKSKFQWTDRIYLIQESGRWVGDDIEYGGDWAFSSKGTLRGKLQGVIDHYRK